MSSIDIQLIKPTTSTIYIGYNSVNDYNYWREDGSTNEIILNISYLYVIINNNSSSGSLLTVNFETSIQFDSNTYFIIGSNYININGNSSYGYTINIYTAGAYYNGLFQNSLQLPISNPNTTLNNSTNNNIYGVFNYITIENINLTTDGLVTINDYQGWIAQAYFGYGGTNNNINNCSTTGNINGYASGGIIGSGSLATVTNCISTNDITGENAGGIFGSSPISEQNLNCNGNGEKQYSYAIGCHSTGLISGNNAGGIFGSIDFYNDYPTLGYAVNCYSTGSIQSNGGGIFGAYSNGIATECYSTGEIIGVGSGGILGEYSSGSATGCWSTGKIIGINNGGIIGQKSSGNIYNCYSTGIIDGINSGGIIGPYSTTIVSNCYSTGNIASQNCGGITSPFSYGAVTNCYSRGDISGIGCGGIYGAYCSTGIATNCYSSGIISGNGAGGIFGVFDPDVLWTGKLIYCYYANGLWGSSSPYTNVELAIKDDITTQNQLSNLRIFIDGVQIWNTSIIPYTLVSNP
jgi:hypothetical protein